MKSIMSKTNLNQTNTSQISSMSGRWESDRNI